MKGQVLLALALAAFFIIGVLRLFGISFAAGDVYPSFSSLRSDARGSRLLFESLAGLPGVSVARSFAPVEFLTGQGFTVLLLGLRPEALGDSERMLNTLEKLAERGNRVVAAFDWRPLLEDPKTVTMQKAWQLRVSVDRDRTHVHHLFFEESPGWKALERAGPKLLAVEKTFGSGSVALFAESEDFTNQSTVAKDRLTEVIAALGPNARVIFDEQHFGIQETATALGMVRRFGLAGFLMGLVLLAALFIWQSAAGFPPPGAAATADHFSGRTSLAGLLTLLKRHIAPPDLAATCLQEWLTTNCRKVSPQRRERAEAVVRGGQLPVESIRELQSVLHAKGEL